jgi:hypothetical protein
MRRLALLLAAVLLLPASLVLAAESGDSASPSGVSGLRATAEGGVVTVAGTAHFAGYAGEAVATSGQDQVDPELSGSLGYVIEEARIGQPDAESGDLVFTYVLQDVTTSLVPELIQFYWDFTLRTADGTTTPFQIDGKASTATTPAQPRFRLRANCGTEGNLFACEATLAAPEVVVDTAANTIAITVPRMALEDFVDTSLAGAEIRHADLFGGIVAQPSGVVVNISNTGYKMNPARPYEVRSPSVAVDLINADGDVVDSGAVLTDGDFSVGLGPVDAGTYTAAVKACFDSAACGSTSTPVVVD